MTEWDKSISWVVLLLAFVANSQQSYIIIKWLFLIENGYEKNSSSTEEDCLPQCSSPSQLPPQYSSSSEEQSLIQSQGHMLFMWWKLHQWNLNRWWGYNMFTLWTRKKCTKSDLFYSIFSSYKIDDWFDCTNLNVKIIKTTISMIIRQIKKKFLWICESNNCNTMIISMIAFLSAIVSSQNAWTIDFIDIGASSHANAMPVT